ncbi:MAG: hypothetical protein EOO02_17275 [Chitinophagaceae bacterium]|nr:MAG: hypothetical protein EOO02_17275 [Chitinophagaceae bacterium]
MNDESGNSYLGMLIISNVFAILQLLAAARWQRLARLSFVLLFAWASCTNWITSQRIPGVYMEYANLAWSDLYRQFINGWFSQHIQLSVGLIATGQALIAIGLAMKQPFFMPACYGAIVFLLAILPLGVGAGFPCTAIMAIALLILSTKEANHYLWKKKEPVRSQ